MCKAGSVTSGSVARGPTQHDSAEMVMPKAWPGAKVEGGESGCPCNGQRAEQVLELDKWIRRRVRQCYWKQWKRARLRRRMLLKLGADRREVSMASRSRKGCWRMSTNSIVQAALTNEWLDQQGVPNLQNLWIAYHYPEQTTTSASALAAPLFVLADPETKR